MASSWGGLLFFFLYLYAVDMLCRIWDVVFYLCTEKLRMVVLWSHLHEVCSDCRMNSELNQLVVHADWLSLSRSLDWFALKFVIIKAIIRRCYKGSFMFQTSWFSKLWGFQINCFSIHVLRSNSNFVKKCFTRIITIC